MPDIASIARSVVRGADPEGKRHGAKIVESWPRVAGEEIARHSRASAFRDGELIVLVESPVWATELSMMSEEFRTGLNRALGENRVDSLRFTVSREAAGGSRATTPEEEPAPPEPPEAIPLDESELAQVEYVTAGIEDDDLRSAAADLMARDLMMKKARAEEEGHKPQDDPSDQQE